MTHLSEDRVKDLFRDIEGRIKRGNPNPIRYLKNLHPSKDEIEGLEWRYRLSGYLEGLAVSDQMDNGFIEPLVATLFSRIAQDVLAHSASILLPNNARPSASTYRQ